MHGGRVRWAALALLALGVTKAAPASAAADLEIVHQARSLRPGEVVLVTLESPEPLQKVSGTVFGKIFPFYASQNARSWQGLIGIDLETRAGRYSVILRGTRVDGTALQARHPLDIRGKEFPTRRLTVEEKYVIPPPDAQERIRRESVRVEAIFARITARKMWDGSFAAPVPGRPNSNFGQRSILNGMPRSPHTGTDFSAEAGTPVDAPNSGQVVLAADLYFSGNTVILDHGLGLYSFFAHLSAISVREGALVKAGEIIGRVGSTGRATGPHLHWTVRLVGTRVDPLSLIAAVTAK